jgi:hypothetical protein
VIERRIALVSCGASKLDRPAPARELYTSNLFRLSAAYAERFFDAWYVLSAFHDLVDPDTELRPYDRSLRDMRMNEREGWGHRVASRLAHAEPGVRASKRPGSGRLIGERHGSYDATTSITLLGGSVYADAMGFYVACEQPLAGLSIGKRMQSLKRALENDVALVATGGGE